MADRHTHRPMDGDGVPCADAERIAACEATACACRPMVERAYRELVGRGQPASHAMEAAAVVLRWHHPEVPDPEASEIVARWVAGPQVH